MKVLFLTVPPPAARPPAQADPVLVRCPGIASKAEYLLPPLGDMCLASLLRREGAAEPVLLDGTTFGMKIPGLVRAVIDINPGLTVITPSTSYIGHIGQVLNVLRKKLPGMKVVVCGSTGAALKHVLVRKKWVDFVITGEPDLTLLQLVYALRNHTKLSRVRGLCYLETEDHVPGKNEVCYAENGIVETSPAPLIPDIDWFPMPARDLIDLGRYRIPFSRRRRFTILTTSRGCPFGCVYCTTPAIYGKVWRAHGVERVIEELKTIRSLGFRDFGFWDDTFTADRSRAAEICEEIIRHRLNMEWIALSRTDTVNRELLHLMKRAGCYQIQYGVESGSARVLAALEKPIPLSTTRLCFRQTRQAGIESAAFFMLGHPLETWEDIDATLNFAMELSPDFVALNLLTPYPGSRLFNELVDSDRKAENIDDMLRLYDCRNAVLLAEPEKALKVKRAFAAFYRKYYFRYSYILGRLYRGLTIHRMISSFRVALSLASWS